MRESSDRPVMDDITIVIKTFERPEAVRASYLSIRTFYPLTPIVVVDDSRLAIDSAEFDRLTTYLKTDFNIGLSAGRNLGVSAVNTKYTMLIDDDMLFTNNTRLDLLKEPLATGEFDICGCRVMNFGRDEILYHGVFDLQENTLKLLIEHMKGHRQGFAVYDFCHNAFLASTSFLKENPWRPELKLREHEEFFYRLHSARPSRVTIRPEVFVEHYPLRTRFYSRYRARVSGYYDLARQMHGLDAIILVPSPKQHLIRQHRQESKGIRRLMNKLARW
ncbi:MAG: glycosyltransferase family 2 protein [Rhizobiaceae bacterium]|nr:MAG: glycosyltransferase family 2 protein [Rhizobiaceae bacterium]MBE0702710.1 glycosyltransferase [Afipia sp.]CAG0962044.1 hypothetical protein RHIZO_00758 [Rhizobiaceae bacterium]